MKNMILKLIFKAAYWLMAEGSEQLHEKHLLRSGWIVEVDDGRIFYTEPLIKKRDKIWIEFENHYYRVYHGDNRVFINLCSTLQWLQLYLFIHDPSGELKTRRIK